MREILFPECPSLPIWQNGHIQTAIVHTLQAVPAMCSTTSNLEHPIEHTTIILPRMARFPVFWEDRIRLTRSHCSFVNSYRFMSYFYASRLFALYFFKQVLNYGKKALD